MAHHFHSIRQGFARAHFGDPRGTAIRPSPPVCSDPTCRAAAVSFSARNSNFATMLTRSFSGTFRACSSASSDSPTRLKAVSPVSSDSPSESDVTVRSGTLRGAKKEMEFVKWFREAWPYIQGHRASTFVIVIPGEVVANASVFDNILQDVALMHGLGVRIVLVPGSHVQINELLKERGFDPVFHGPYRVTDQEALEAAMEASGRTRVDIEAKLSRGPVIPVLRRHGESEKWHEVGISVASGNFVHAKRRGVAGGIDFGATGEVKRVEVERIKNRLDNGCVVLLSNLGFSSAGEVLNCNTYEVATLCASSIRADKLICLLDGPLVDASGRLIRWMTLLEADRLIRERASVSYTAADYVAAVAGADYIKSLGLETSSGVASLSSASKETATAASAGVGAVNGATKEAPELTPSGVWVESMESGSGGKGVAEIGATVKEEDEEEAEEAAASLARWNAQRALYSMDWAKPKPLPLLNNNGKGNGSVARRRGQNGKMGFAIGGEERQSGSYGFLSELTAAVFACRGGVRRVHLLDSSLEGSLLLELYTRDGIGTMISSDLYEGTRGAQMSDVRGIQVLLKPLEDAGVLVKRTEERLSQELPYFTVVERDGALIACAALFPFPADSTAEVAAFAVSPAARGHGRGDNLLDYLEKRAQEMGLSSLFLLTTRTADWFVQRGFAPCDLETLPPDRLAKVDRSRGSKSFRKNLGGTEESEEEREESLSAIPTDLAKFEKPPA